MILFISSLLYYSGISKKPTFCVWRYFLLITLCVILRKYNAYILVGIIYYLFVFLSAVVLPRSVL